MIQQWLHNTFAFGMTILLLLSTVSFSVKKKYCSDSLVDITVLPEFETCCGISLKDVKAGLKSSCCSEKAEIIEGQPIINNVTFSDLDEDQKLVLTAFVFFYVNLFEGLPQFYIPHELYDPPKLVVDKLPLEQVYLI